MSKFDIKKALPVAVVTAGVAAGAHALSAVPVAGVYSSGLLGGQYFLQLNQHVAYSATSTATTGVIAVDLKGSGTVPTWGFALSQGNLNLGAAGSTTLRSTFSTTTLNCQVDYQLSQDSTTNALYLASASASAVSRVTGTVALTAGDNTSCGQTFQSRTGVTMSAGNQTGSAGYTFIF